VSIFIAIILGIIQGLTEFLPVSSSGHLVLFQRIFGINVDCILFDVVLHFGTVVAIIVVFRKQILELIKNPFSQKAIYLYLATFITGIIAIIFNDFFEKSFNGNALFAGFFVTAVFLTITEIISRKHYQYKSMDYKRAMFVGMFQGIAIMPGISRSGSTITSLIFQGVRRDESAEFSFILSIPIIFLSAVYELIKSPQSAVSIPLSCYFVGFIFASFSGFLAIKLMLKVIKKARYTGFIVYLLLLSIFLFLNQFVLFWF